MIRHLLQPSLRLRLVRACCGWGTIDSTVVVMHDEHKLATTLRAYRDDVAAAPAQECLSENRLTINGTRMSALLHHGGACEEGPT
jgi:hypothetical protein